MTISKKSLYIAVLLALGLNMPFITSAKEPLRIINYDREETNIRRYKQIGCVTAMGLAYMSALVLKTDDQNSLAGGIGAMALLTAMYLAISHDAD